jgi:hypothetical protein
MQATLSALRSFSIGRAVRLGGRRAAVVVAALACLFVLSVTVASAAAETATYSATETVPVPPASNFKGNGGGDGWAVALSKTAVYNVFHHQQFIGVACHLQSNAENCTNGVWPKTITETGTGAGFTSQPQPGLYLNQTTGDLYVYATRLTDDTGGVVCIETTSDAEDPFCGFTELTGKGEAPPTEDRGISGFGDPMLIERAGQKLWYSFNFAEGTQEGDKDEVTCFDVSTGAACPGQPYPVTLPAGTIETENNEPDGETAAIGGDAIIPMNVSGQAWLACYDPAEGESCDGKWPVKVGGDYEYGAPFPLLSATGTTTGLCVPNGSEQCYNLEGESVPTPANLAAVIGATEEWNGPGLIIGPRVYIPHAFSPEGEAVDCFDYSTDESCANFPKALPGIVLLYTVNPDPQRPTCIWVNSDADDGTQPVQIESFDAYTGEACGQGTIRVLASQFVVPQPQCTPANYVSLQVLKPERTLYKEGVVAFDNGDGNSIPGLEPITLDETGSASLAGLELNTPTGLPQFVFTLKEPTGEIGEVEVKLTWQGNYDATCAEEGRAPAPPATKQEPTPEAKKEEAKTTTTTTTTPAPTPKGEVASFGAAHLASSAPACVASNGYMASVGGNLIASVTFTLGGHKVATVTKPNSHGVYATRIKLPVGSKKKLAIKVVFTSASKVHETTIHKTLARCAVVHHITTPRFTG